MNNIAISISIDEFSYVQGHPILRDINIEFEKGYILGIMGENGCGKSTILKLISRSIYSNSVDILYSFPLNKIEIVYQDYRESLFPWKTAYENICLPTLFNSSHFVDSDFMNTFIKKFNIDFDLKKLPQNLSGGEQQKIVVLRSLMSLPELLLLDEPCSAMDYSSRYLFLRQLRNKLKEDNTTAVMVSHTAEDIFIFCDMLLLVTKDGTTGKLLKNCQSKNDYLENLDTINEFFNSK